MSVSIFIAVLLAAFLHACWNGLVKSTDDKLASMTAVSLGGIPIALVLLFFVPVPDLSSLPWLFASMVCHIGYQLSLIMSYRLGDYTTVYPIARGSAPMWVTLVSLVLLDSPLSLIELFAICLVCFGIFSISFARQQDGFRSFRAVGAALLTGFFIASYSLLDGLGARAADTPLGYLAWLMVLDGFVFYVLVGFYDRSVLLKVFTSERRSFYLGGSASVIAYGIVIWAMFTAPIALVVTLRETSVVFALFIGVLFLGERLTTFKILAVLVALSGVVILRLATSGYS